MNRTFALTYMLYVKDEGFNLVFLFVVVPLDVGTYLQGFHIFRGTNIFFKEITIELSKLAQDWNKLWVLHSLFITF